MKKLLSLSRPKKSSKFPLLAGALVVVSALALGVAFIITDKPCAVSMSPRCKMDLVHNYQRWVRKMGIQTPKYGVRLIQNFQYVERVMFVIPQELIPATVKHFYSTRADVIRHRKSAPEVRDLAQSEGLTTMLFDNALFQRLSQHPKSLKAYYEGERLQVIAFRTGNVVSLYYPSGDPREFQPMAVFRQGEYGYTLESISWDWIEKEN